MALECIVRWDSHFDAMKPIEYGVIYRSDNRFMLLHWSCIQMGCIALHHIIFHPLPCCSYYVGIVSIPSMQLSSALGQAIFCAKKAPADHIFVKNRGLLLLDFNSFWGDRTTISFYWVSVSFQIFNYPRGV